VKKLSDKRKRQWLHTYNSARKKCISDGGSEKHCDGRAIHIANGVIKKQEGRAMGKLEEIWNQIKEIFLPELEQERVATAVALKIQRMRLTTRDVIERQTDGRHRLFSVSAISALNRVGEIDSRKLFDSFIEHWQETGEAPLRDFMHLGPLSDHFRTGDVDFMARDGNVFVTSTLFRDTPLAQAEVHSRQQNPEYWGDSIYYSPGTEPEVIEVDGEEVRVYNEGKLRFVSTVPEELAASHLTTSVQFQEVGRMWDNLSEHTRNELVSLLGEDSAKQLWIDAIDPINRQIEEEDMVTRSTEEDTPEPESTEVEGEVFEVEFDEEMMAEIVNRVSASMDFAELLAPLTESVNALQATVEQLASDIEHTKVERDALQIKIDELGRTDEEKLIELVDDFPRKRRVNVAFRPREEAGKGDENFTDRADAALEAWGTREYYQS